MAGGHVEVVPLKVIARDGRAGLTDACPFRYAARQQRLAFLPLPQGQGSLRPILDFGE